jgi:hypothetical protein
MSQTEIRIVGECVTALEAGTESARTTVTDFVERVCGESRRAPSCELLPAGTRAWIERADYVATCIEVATHARTVHWITDDSPVPSGEEASYERRFLAFPYVEILLVLRSGRLTGLQQLYYRRAPLAADDQELLLPNLLNVSPNSYQQRAWLCLANLADIGELDWDRKFAAVVDHVFSASFNRSSEMAEGRSYWSSVRPVDVRVASVERWERASRENPRFVLEVAWRSAGVTLQDELNRMLDTVAAHAPLGSATDLAGTLAPRRRRRRRALCFPSF